MDNFPIDFFPEELQRIIHEVSGTYQFSKDYLAASILSVVASAVGNVYHVRIKDGWTERSALYMAIVGLPGWNKTAPPKFAMRPVHEREKQLYKQYKRDVEEFLSDEKNAGKTPPPLIKTIVSDITPESVVQQLNKNERGILVWRDELKSFFDSFQRYQNSSEEFYLELWSCSPVVVDRKTSTSIMITEPVVNVIGTIQPEVLKRAFDGKTENGFADRWLITLPHGLKKECWSDEDLRPEVYIEYKRIIDRLQDLNFEMESYDTVKSQALVYEPEAWRTLKAWQSKNTAAINKTDNAGDKGIRAKMETYIHRFAMIHHMALFACKDSTFFRPSTKITAASCIQASRIADYYIGCAMRFRSDNPKEGMSDLQQEVVDMIPDAIPFTTAQFIDMCAYKDVSLITAKRWLKAWDKKVFVKEGHGKYMKL